MVFHSNDAPPSPTISVTQNESKIGSMRRLDSITPVEIEQSSPIMVKIELNLPRRDSTSSFGSKGCLKRIDGKKDCKSKGITKRRVSFDSIEINQFDMVLGDNPSATGVPVTLGWKAHNVDRFAIDTYERSKPTPRNSRNLVLSPDKRKCIAQSKASKSQINLALKEMRIIQLYRVSSVENMQYDEWEYKKEKMERKLKNIVTLNFLKKPPPSGKVKKNSNRKSRGLRSFKNKS